MIITPPLEELQQSASPSPLCNSTTSSSPPQQQQQILRLSQASEASEAPSDSSELTVPASTGGSSPAGKLRRYRGDTSKRRKGVYITQWPEPEPPASSGSVTGSRLLLSGQSSEERDEPPPSATPSDLSDCEGQAPRRSVCDVCRVD